MYKNDFLKYYGEKNISPVEQDIADLQAHYAKREKLYRQLGMPVMMFKDKEICEVGAGSGYNTLAFFNWEVKHVDIVEANPCGVMNMKQLFKEKSVEEDKYSIYEMAIEQFETYKKYDIVIAEGFLSHIPNQQEVIDKLKSICKEDGIVVVTCDDDTCLYIERMKRLIAHVLIGDIKDYEEQVEYLAQIFEPQLKQLRGVSRGAKDWVKDQLLNPAMINNCSLNMVEAMYKFGEKCKCYGTSPRMFTDYSWYKDIWNNEIVNYEEQYTRKNASLMLSTLKEEICLSQEEGEKLNHLVSESKKLQAIYEKNKNVSILSDIKKCNDDICSILNEKSKDLTCVLRDISLAITDLIENGIEQFDFSKYQYFFSAFGRTLHYVSFKNSI